MGKYNKWNAINEHKLFGEELAEKHLSLIRKVVKEWREKYMKIETRYTEINHGEYEAITEEVYTVFKVDNDLREKVNKYLNMLEMNNSSVSVEYEQNSVNIQWTDKVLFNINNVPDFNISLIITKVTKDENVIT